MRPIWCGIHLLIPNDIQVSFVQGLYGLLVQLSKADTVLLNKDVYPSIVKYPYKLPGRERSSPVELRKRIDQESREL